MTYKEYFSKFRKEENFDIEHASICVHITDVLTGFISALGDGKKLQKLVEFFSQNDDALLRAKIIKIASRVMQEVDFEVDDEGIYKNTDMPLEMYIRSYIAKVVAHNIALGNFDDLLDYKIKIRE